MSIPPRPPHAGIRFPEQSNRGRPNGRRKVHRPPVGTKKHPTALLQGSQAFKVGGGKGIHRFPGECLDFFRRCFVTRSPRKDDGLSVPMVKPFRKGCEFLRAPAIRRNPAAQMKSHESKGINPFFPKKGIHDFPVLLGNGDRQVRLRRADTKGGQQMEHLFHLVPFRKRRDSQVIEESKPPIPSPRFVSQSNSRPCKINNPGLRPSEGRSHADRQVKSRSS